MRELFPNVFTEHTLKNKVKEWLRRPDSKKYLALACIFLVILTCFFYFRDIRVESLKIGTISKRFLINQTDFTYFDKQSTSILKQQVRFDVGPIYRIDERNLLLQCQNIKARLVSDPLWKERLPICNYQQISKTLDHFADRALKARFTDARTLKKISSAKAGVDLAFFPLLHHSDVVPHNFWQQLANENKHDPIVNECLHFTIAQLENCPFLLSEDIELENGYKEYIADSVAPIYTPFKAGHILLSPGEKITDRHGEILHSMKEKMRESEALWNFKNFAASFALASVLTILIIVYLQAYHSSLCGNFKKMLLLAIIIILSLCVGKGVEFFVMYGEGTWKEGLRYPPLFVLSSIMISLLISRSIAVFSLLFLLVLSWFFLSFDPERFSLLNLIASLAAIPACHKMHRRRQIFTGCLKVWLFTIPVLLAFHLIDKDLFSSMVLRDIGGNLVFLVSLSLLVILLLPMIEAKFHVITDMTLTEYLDPNNELLRRLSLEAPGTYQHCLVVAHLAEGAARAIRANDLFCRVATLYHDIGKLFHPQYFTENQLGGFNIHQLLTPKESAQVIIAHAEEGELLGKKFHLPSQFLDVIREHHGTTLVYYFYSKELELQKGDQSLVDQASFRYKGPKPHSKESAIIMIADCVEAASRCLESATENDLEAMVNKIIREKEFDGQFDECQLTFEELGKIRKAIVKALMITHHVRVKYPAKEVMAPSLFA